MLFPRLPVVGRCRDFISFISFCSSLMDPLCISGYRSAVGMVFFSIGLIGRLRSLAVMRFDWWLCAWSAGGRTTGRTDGRSVGRSVDRFVSDDRLDVCAMMLYFVYFVVYHKRFINFSFGLFDLSVGECCECFSFLLVRSYLQNAVCNLARHHLFLDTFTALSWWSYSCSYAPIFELTFAKCSIQRFFFSLFYDFFFFEISVW